MDTEYLRQLREQGEPQSNPWNQTDRIAALEAENARLRQENKNAVYGCCEECGIEAEVERLRWQLETLIDDTFNRTCFAGWSRLSIGADLDRRWKERT